MKLHFHLYECEVELDEKRTKEGFRRDRRDA